MESQNSRDYRRMAEIDPDQNLSTEHTDAHAILSPPCSGRIDKEGITDGGLCKLGIAECTSEMIASTANEQPLQQEQESDSNSHGVLIENHQIKEIRKRTFSHWPLRASPSAAQMIEAGFFSCNVGDRVICIYCNIICQQWMPNGDDDPCEVHKILSPKCPYFLTMSTAATSSSTRNNLLPSNETISNTAWHPRYSDSAERTKTFASGSNENLPAVDSLVRAGFFYTDNRTIVTCFYCNGSLQNWGANDNPMIEHARWFPHCAYARQLCGTDLYRRIQESKRTQQERARTNTADSASGTGSSNRKHGQLVIPDENTLSRYVAARLDLPFSQSLLRRNFKLSIIKRCYEDQLRLKHDDFATDADLSIACIILQKQVDCIDGKKENIIVPSVAMKRIREQHQADSHLQNGSKTSACESTALVSSSIISRTTQDPRSASSTSRVEMDTQPLSPINPCVLCLTRERRLALLLCIHDFTNHFDAIHGEFSFQENPCPYIEKTMSTL